jgi:hypothetical protein
VLCSPLIKAYCDGWRVVWPVRAAWSGEKPVQFDQLWCLVSQPRPVWYDRKLAGKGWGASGVILNRFGVSYRGEA